MKVLIFNPYFETLGGGERYSLTVAEFFLRKGLEVELAWNKKNINKRVKNRFNIDVEKLKINPFLYKIFTQKTTLLEKYKKTSRFDIIFFVSDGSIPLLFSKKNIILFQVPFKGIGGKSLGNQLKLKLMNKTICYSFFVKKTIDEEYKIDSQVLYPCVAQEFKPGKKENIILSVGRFDSLLNSKKHDVLVKVFKELVIKKKLKSWKLILAGSLLNKNDFVEYLEKISLGFPIEIKTNVSFNTIKGLYSQAKIYWHAAGFGENLLKNPERAEHFGISVLEAMAAGCLPIVFNGGGLPEIVKDKESGFLFNNLSQLGSLTLRVIKSKDLFEKISQRARERVEDFSKEHFFQKLDGIIK